MQNTMTPIFIAHVTAGSLMLISGAASMLARKANKIHRRSGITYAVATSVVCFTGLAISIPRSNEFLIAVSIFTAYMLATSYRSLYLKQLYKIIKAEPIDWLILFFGAASAAFLMYMGIKALMMGKMAGLVPLAFGFTALGFTYRDYQKFTKGPDDKKHWLYNHIRGMVGSYIAGFTAFLAVNAGFFSNSFNLFVWLTPTIIGTPLIMYWTRKYKAKGDDLKTELKLKIHTEE